jgi:hypothetical protein
MAKPISRKAALAMGALTPYLAGKLAADAKISILPTLATVTAKTWAADKTRIKIALDAACKGKLAVDADLEDVIELLDTLDDVTDEVADVVASEIAAPEPAEAALDDDGEMMDRLSGVLKAQGLTDEQIAAVMAAMKPEVDGEPPAKTAQDDKEKGAKDTDDKADKDKPVGITKTAMDAAIKVAANAAAAAAETATIARLRGVQKAEREVHPFIGALDAAPDNAPAVYRLALDHAGVDLTDVPSSAYGALLRALPKPEAVRPQVEKVAMDGAAEAFEKRFPLANRFVQ